MEQATFLWFVSYVSEDSTKGMTTVVKDLRVKFHESLADVQYRLFNAKGESTCLSLATRV